MMEPSFVIKLQSVKQLNAILILFFAVFAGCKSDKYRRAADKEVFEILNQRSNLVLGANASTNLVSSQVGNNPESVTPSEIVKERFADSVRTINLPQALDMAEKNNRAYQLQREKLYLSALSLTGVRHQFSWITTSSVDAEIDRGTDGGLSGDSQISLGAQKMFKKGGCNDGNSRQRFSPLF